jgi:hypothetical protein
MIFCIWNISYAVNRCPIPCGTRASLKPSSMQELKRTPSPRRSVSLALAQGISELVQRTSEKLRLLPQIGRQEAVRVNNSHEGGLECVLESFGGTGGCGVSVLDTSELEKTLDSWRGDEAGTTRSRNELSMMLAWKRHGNGRVEHTLTVTEPHLPLSLVGRE